MRSFEVKTCFVFLRICVGRKSGSVLSKNMLCFAYSQTSTSCPTFSVPFLHNPPVSAVAVPFPTSLASFHLCTHLISRHPSFPSGLPTEYISCCLWLRLSEGYDLKSNFSEATPKIELRNNTKYYNAQESVCDGVSDIKKHCVAQPHTN